MSAAEFKKDPNFDRILHAGIVEGLNSIQIRYSMKLRDKLSKPGTGRIYRIGKGKASGRNLRARGFHRASAPGNAPAVNTNRLRASWSIAGMGPQQADSFLRFYERGPLTVMEFGSRVLYAPFLEYGTRRMKPRPYIKPATLDVLPGVGRIMGTAIKRAFGQ